MFKDESMCGENIGQVEVETRLLDQVGSGGG